MAELIHKHFLNIYWAPWRMQCVGVYAHFTEEQTGSERGREVNKGHWGSNPKPTLNIVGVRLVAPRRHSGNGLLGPWAPQGKFSPVGGSATPLSS